MCVGVSTQARLCLRECVCMSACVKKAFSSSERWEFKNTDTEIEIEGESRRAGAVERENNLMLCYPCKT